MDDKKDSLTTKGVDISASFAAVREALGDLREADYDAACAHVERIRTALTAAEKDAAKYRWLTKDLIDWSEYDGTRTFMICDRQFRGATKDEAIDAAMAKEALS